jgi:hypothetical protein
MKCDELRDEYELYALGLADEPEKAELREHLNRGCATCTSGVRTARELAAVMAGTAPAVAPPARLRKRILASAGVEQRSWGWAPVWAAACALSLLAGFYFYSREQDTARTLARMQDQARQQSIELARLNEVLSLLNQPETRDVVFGQGPQGRVFVHPKSGVLLIASNLPPAPAGKTYEMWVIPKGGAKPVRAGEFQSAQDGTALHLQRGPVDLATTAIIAVTLEPAGGVDQPTSTPVIAATL